MSTFYFVVDAFDVKVDIFCAQFNIFSENTLLVSSLLIISSNSDYLFKEDGRGSIESVFVETDSGSYQFPFIPVPR